MERDRSYHSPQLISEVLSPISPKAEVLELTTGHFVVLYVLETRRKEGSGVLL